MSRAYIYVKDLESTEVLTLGRLSIDNGRGEFVYDPDYVANRKWVPDPIRYPLRVQPFRGITTKIVECLASSTTQCPMVGVSGFCKIFIVRI